MSIIESLTSLFAPNDCLGCGREGDLLCTACIPALPPLPGRCFGCHRQLPRAAGCPTCCAAVGLTNLRAVAAYDSLAKALITQLKFHGNQSATKQMAALMLNGLRLPPTALLTHIPATTQHIRQRGYDQAELIARHISRLSGCRHRALLARHGQVHQLGAGRVERLTQLKQALRLSGPTGIAGHQIILIDDVLTTGSTLSAAASLLRQAGAQRVDGLVFAQA